MSKFKKTYRFFMESSGNVCPASKHTTCIASKSWLPYQALFAYLCHIKRLTTQYYHNLCDVPWLLVPKLGQIKFFALKNGLQSSTLRHPVKAWVLSAVYLVNASSPTSCSFAFTFLSFFDCSGRQRCFLSLFSEMVLSR